MRSKLLAVAAAFACGIAATFPSGAFDPNAYLAHIRYLASPELQGRGAGTPGLEMAEQYIERQLRADGLTPHSQAFQLTIDATLGPKYWLCRTTVAGLTKGTTSAM